MRPFFVQKALDCEMPHNVPIAQRTPWIADRQPAFSQISEWLTTLASSELGDTLALEHVDERMLAHTSRRVWPVPGACTP
jgi:hypothetical protein